jgi:hypothetical protein
MEDLPMQYGGFVHAGTNGYISSRGETRLMITVWAAAGLGYAAPRPSAGRLGLQAGEEEKRAVGGQEMLAQAVCGTESLKHCTMFSCKWEVRAFWYEGLRQGRYSRADTIGHIQQDSRTDTAGRGTTIERGRQQDVDYNREWATYNKYGRATTGLQQIQ